VGQDASQREPTCEDRVTGHPAGEVAEVCHGDRALPVGLSLRRLMCATMR
jgi:hypothetical protein